MHRRTWQPSAWVHWLGDCLFKGISDDFTCSDPEHGTGAVAPAGYWAKNRLPPDVLPARMRQMMWRRTWQMRCSELKNGIVYCQVCFNITGAGRQECEICSSSERDGRLVCVVEEPLDVLALERVGVTRAVTMCLHGALSPIEGVGPEDLTIRELLERVRGGGVQEVILATNPSMEGDATAMYLTAAAGAV